MRIEIDTHDGTPEQIERRIYEVPAPREGLEVEVSQAQYDALLQHPRSDMVFGTFMGARLIVV